MKFKNYGFAKEIKKNIENLGFTRPTDIQYKSIPAIMNKEDILAIAQTGTGKTGAFAIPVVDMIHKIKSNKQSYGIKYWLWSLPENWQCRRGRFFQNFPKTQK